MKRKATTALLASTTLSLLLLNTPAVGKMRQIMDENNNILTKSISVKANSGPQPMADELESNKIKELKKEKKKKANKKKLKNKNVSNQKKN